MEVLELPLEHQVEQQPPLDKVMMEDKLLLGLLVQIKGLQVVAAAQELLVKKVNPIIMAEMAEAD